MRLDTPWETLRRAGDTAKTKRCPPCAIWPAVRVPSVCRVSWKQSKEVTFRNCRCKMHGQADLSPFRKATQATGPNTSTGPSGSLLSRTPTTAPSWPTSAQLPLALYEDVRQDATSVHAPWSALAVLVRHMARPRPRRASWRPG